MCVYLPTLRKWKTESKRNKTFIFIRYSRETIGIFHLTKVSLPIRLQYSRPHRIVSFAVCCFYCNNKRPLVFWLAIDKQDGSAKKVKLVRKGIVQSQMVRRKLTPAQTQRNAVIVNLHQCDGMQAE
jgi:hypothetical protein